MFFSLTLERGEDKGGGRGGERHRDRDIDVREK